MVILFFKDNNYFIYSCDNVRFRVKFNYFIFFDSLDWK